MIRTPFAAAIAVAAFASAPAFAQGATPAARSDAVKTKPVCSTLKSRTGGNLAGSANAQGRSANSAVALDCTPDSTALPGAGEYALDSRTATPVSPATTVNTPRSADNPVYTKDAVAGTSGTTSGRVDHTTQPMTTPVGPKANVQDKSALTSGSTASGTAKAPGTLQ